MLPKEINEDFQRAEEALKSAERNVEEGDLYTAANRAFVACENSVYALLKLQFGSSSLSRMRILTRLQQIDRELKETYDQSYDLRVQADYGKEAKHLPLTKENVERILRKVKGVVEQVGRKITSEEIKQ